MLDSDDAVEQGVPIVAVRERELLAMVSDEAVEMLQQGSAVEVFQSDESVDDWPWFQLMNCVSEADVQLHEAGDGQEEGAHNTGHGVTVPRVDADEFPLVDVVGSDEHHEVKSQILSVLLIIDEAQKQILLCLWGVDEDVGAQGLDDGLIVICEALDGVGALDDGREDVPVHWDISQGR